jgi:uncharacterized protein
MPLIFAPTEGNEPSAPTSRVRGIGALAYCRTTKASVRRPMHPNEELLRREYEAFARNDLDALARIFSDDVVYHIPGAGPLSGEHRGREAIFRLFDIDRGAAFTSEIHDVLADDRHAVALTHVRGRRADRTLDDITVHVVHVIDGKIAEAWLFPWNQAASDAFWA